MNNPNPELQLLESIYAVTGEGQRPALVSQRELANSAGLSLGLTNTLLKRFIERGWVKLMHVDGRKIMYGLTPMGMEEIAMRTLRYFARAVHNASLHRRRIDAFVDEIARRGCGRLLLLGPAEIDFLVEYSCLKHGVHFFKSAKACLDEIEDEGGACEDLVAICADSEAKSGGDNEIDIGLRADVPIDLRDARGTASDSTTEAKEGAEVSLAAVKRRAGLPQSVPVIRFSQILMGGGAAHVM